MFKYFLLAFGAGLFATYLVRSLARRFRVADYPDGARKRHGRAVPLLGGIGLFAAFWGVAWYLLAFHSVYGLPNVGRELELFFYGSAALLLMGIWDDVRPFSGKIRLVVLLVVLGAIAWMLPLGRLTNPLGSYFSLAPALGSLIVFGWLFVTTISVKLLDAVDGLAASTAIVNAFVIGGLTLTRTFYQPNVALVAVIFAGVLLGFLIFNRPPATIFLGESGSLFVGFMLGALAILSGSKIATALLVMAVPVLDVVRVVMIRWRDNQPLFQGDRRHLPLVLLDRGWSAWQVLIFLVSIALVAGLVGLFLQSAAKLIALTLVAIGFFLLVVRFGLMKNS